MGQETAHDGATLEAATPAHQHAPGIPCRCQTDFFDSLPFLAAVLAVVLIIHRLKSWIRDRRKGESTNAAKENGND